MKGKLAKLKRYYNLISTLQIFLLLYKASRLTFLKTSIIMSDPIPLECSLPRI